MGMKEGSVFNETSWSFIEELLPDDEKIKLAVLHDFMWFFSRSKKYKNNQQVIDDYIRHLELKSNLDFDNIANHTDAFKKIDIMLLKQRLKDYYR